MKSILTLITVAILLSVGQVAKADMDLRIMDAFWGGPALGCVKWDVHILREDGEALQGIRPLIAEPEHPDLVSQDGNDIVGDTKTFGHYDGVRIAVPADQEMRVVGTLKRCENDELILHFDKPFTTKEFGSHRYLTGGGYQLGARYY